MARSVAVISNPFFSPLEGSLDYLKIFNVTPNNRRPRKLLLNKKNHKKSENSRYVVIKILYHSTLENPILEKLHKNLGTLKKTSTPSKAHENIVIIIILIRIYKGSLVIFGTSCQKGHRGTQKKEVIQLPVVSAADLFEKSNLSPQ